MVSLEASQGWRRSAKGQSPSLCRGVGWLAPARARLPPWGFPLPGYMEAVVPNDRIRSPQQNASGLWDAMQLREVGNSDAQLWKMRWLHRTLCSPVWN